MDLTDKIIAELRTSLGESTLAERSVWVQQVFTQKLNVMRLCILLQADTKVATRFSWMLTEIGEADAGMLLAVLPALFRERFQTNVKGFPVKFSKYWRVVGVPLENEAVAIDLLFEWLSGGEVNISTRTYSASVLFNLVAKYGDLRHELRIVLEEKRDKYSRAFQKKVDGYLAALRG
ncbi:MAG TPA: hypothetical protein ENJ82_14820 [Bacteroidetes bacterium]|nr:hypothetical protein [Bacteroidota bacterium]